MSSEQLPLAFKPATAYGEGDFLATADNHEALAWVSRWPDWPAYGLVVCGPEGAGKTHLAHIWAARAAADFATSLAIGQNARLVVEDMDRWLAEGEEALFHLLNHMAARKGWLLLTTRVAPVDLQLRYPDVKSRLLALPVAHIRAPEDEALRAVMSKLFSDRQLQVGPDVLDYLIRRIERSYAAAAGAVAALDAAALATGRPIALPLAREVLARMGEQA